MKRIRIVIWLVITFILSGLAIPLAFFNWQTILVAFLVYLPLTAVLVWLLVYRGGAWAKLGFFGLWLLVFWGWLTYIGPYVEALFDNLPGDTF